MNHCQFFCPIDICLLHAAPFRLNTHTTQNTTRTNSEVAGLNYYAAAEGTHIRKRVGEYCLLDTPQRINSASIK